MSSTSGIAPLKFVSEAEIEEKRKKRQEEWEKVRQPHQPLGTLSLLQSFSILNLMDVVICTFVIHSGMETFL